MLVIDDDAWTRSVVADFLMGEGFRLEQASDATTGLSMAEQVQPDVILLDLALPRRSGLKVLHQLKERQPTREIPLIIVSAYALLLVRDDIIRADRLLQKPFDLRMLLDYVKQVVGGPHPRFRLLPPTPGSA